ncbi:MAG: threonine synthase, partial [Sphingomicrobium sp.]
MAVTHLECSLTGERYPADEIHNLSRAGKPLLARYDFGQARRTLTRDAIAGRAPGMWKWGELLPLAEITVPVSLGEIETPILTLARTGGPNLLVKDEGRLPTGSFKARGLAMAVTM